MSNQAMRNLGKLAWHVCALILLCLGATMLVRWGFNAQEASRRENAVAEARYQEAAARLRKVGIEEQEVKEKSALLVKLSRSGIVGDEHRLEWIELLQRLRDDLRLPELTYEFAPRAPLYAAVPGGYAFFSSPLKVHLRLLHEGDLIRFLGMLQQDARALVLVRECKVTRVSGTDNPLGADCEFEWITARLEGRTQ